MRSIFCYFLTFDEDLLQKQVYYICKHRNISSLRWAFVIQNLDRIFLEDI